MNTALTRPASWMIEANDQACRMLANALSDVAVETRRPDATSAPTKVDANRLKIRVEGELDGVAYGHVLLTHLPVEVEGIGQTYGGAYYVDQVTHHFTADGQTESGQHRPVGERIAINTFRYIAVIVPAIPSGILWVF